MENSLLAIFDEIWPKSLYYSTGTLARLLSKFKNPLTSEHYAKSCGKPGLTYLNRIQKQVDL